MRYYFPFESSFNKMEISANEGKFRLDSGSLVAFFLLYALASALQPSVNEQETKFEELLKSRNLYIYV